MKRIIKPIASTHTPCDCSRVPFKSSGDKFSCCHHHTHSHIHTFTKSTYSQPVIIVPFLFFNIPYPILYKQLTCRKRFLLLADIMQVGKMHVRVKTCGAWRAYRLFSYFFLIAPHRRGSWRPLLPPFQPSINPAGFFVLLCNVSYFVAVPRQVSPLLSKACYPIHPHLAATANPIMTLSLRVNNPKKKGRLQMTMMQKGKHRQ